MTDLEGKLFMAGLVTDIYTIGYGGYRGLMAGLGMPVDIGSSNSEIVIAGLSGLTAAKWGGVFLGSSDPPDPDPYKEDIGVFLAPLVAGGIWATEFGVGYALGYGVGKLIDLL